MTSLRSPAWLDPADHGVSGSSWNGSGTSRAGSCQLELAEIGDFQVGHWVSIPGCCLHHYGSVYSADKPYLPPNPFPLSNEVELRGLDDDRHWQTFLLHFTTPDRFDWMVVDSRFQTLTHHQPVLRREWCWQGEDVPIHDEWLPLADGVELRLRHQQWEAGQCIALHARNRLVARIEAIDGTTLTLSAAADRDASGLVIRHHDQVPLQAALDRAVANHQNLYLPPGRYRLSEGLWLRHASLHIEGAGREQTTLDVSEDTAPCFWIAGGRDVGIHNLGMVGHTGFLELPANVHFSTATGHPFWPTANQQMEVKGCAAANVVGTEHLLFEDLLVRRMASEAFYLHGSDRDGSAPYIQEPHMDMPELAEQYTKSCTYQRCRVEDCGFNAFNNNDHAENTSILHCHVERATNFCENASRFTRIIGNYLLDGCATSVHGGGRSEAGRQLSTTQAIISDNVFEGGCLGGGLSIANSAGQVTITNNQFIGYGKETAICVSDVNPGGFPVRQLIITGNSIDLTAMPGTPDNDRAGISLEASNAIIANNHIFVRGSSEAPITGVHIADHACNIQLHDNTIENCAVGIRSGRRVYLYDEQRFIFMHTTATVREVVDPRRFRQDELPPLTPHLPQAGTWQLHGLDRLAGKILLVESVDAESGLVVLEDDADLEVGDLVALVPRQPNWLIHHNILHHCQAPWRLDLLHQQAIAIRDNLPPC